MAEGLFKIYQGGGAGLCVSDRGSKTGMEDPICAYRQGTIFPELNNLDKTGNTHG